MSFQDIVNRERAEAWESLRRGELREDPDYGRRHNPWVPFCEGGSGTCATCVGSCGIEEYEEREALSGLSAVTHRTDA